MSRPAQRLVGAIVVFVAFAGLSAALAGRSAAAADNYVALGDSYSSGVGTGSYTLSSSCKRSTAAYPYLLDDQTRLTRNRAIEIAAMA